MSVLAKHFQWVGYKVTNLYTELPSLMIILPDPLWFTSAPFDKFLAGDACCHVLPPKEASLLFRRTDFSRSWDAPLLPSRSLLRRRGGGGGR
jgi:hypothetical protein